MNDFIMGWSGSVSGGVGIGSSAIKSFNPNKPLAIGYGLFTPQAGVSVGPASVMPKPTLRPNPKPEYAKPH